jgi:hypothetical protein
MLNLAMLIQSKKNNTKEFNNLKDLAIKLNDLQIKHLNLTSNGALFTGDSMFSSHIYSSNNETVIRNNSLSNGFAYFNSTNCRKVLMNFYSLSEDTEIIFVTNNFNGTLNLNQTDSYMISAYNLITKEKLNIDICKNTTGVIQMPINLPNFNQTFYTEMKQEGIDILDPKDPIFNDRCMSYVDKPTNADTTINWRRGAYLGGIMPLCRGVNCKYNGVTDDGYVNCTCGIGTDTEIQSISISVALDSINNINFEIITCPNVWVIYF